MLKLGTKAETISSLHGKLKKAAVLPSFFFTVGRWDREREAILKEYASLTWNQDVIVRSSALDEDTGSHSMAGQFDSVPGVKGIYEFESAVDRVVSSYGSPDRENQVLVQPMVEGVLASGVAFTLDPNGGGNYYVINYDESGKTDVVTSGGGASKLTYVFKGRELRGKGAIAMVCAALAELEALFGRDKLDVEFAVTKGLGLVVLQVRPLCMPGEGVDAGKQAEELGRIQEKVCSMSRPKPFLCGESTIFGVMADWNPAEMIGVRPKRLALSLYKEVVTDNIWAYQRDNYGYRNLRSFPLMVDFCGLPYIDIRVSFNSFIPAGLDRGISEKLANYYLDRLREDTKKHDKVEFDVVFSCYTLDLPERIQVLGAHGFTQGEIGQILDALRGLTNNIIDAQNGLWRKDYGKLKTLEGRYGEVVGSGMGSIEKVYWLLEDCKRYGTLPFAGLARAAFIAVQMLQSMVAKGIISQADYQGFMNGVYTVNSAMKDDLRWMPKAQFLEKYGHLRPGTYDITSRRYDEAPDEYFDWGHRAQPGVQGVGQGEFRMSVGQMHMLTEELGRNGLGSDILGLMDFIKGAIEGREYGKFLFTKSISKVLWLIGEVGRGYGLDRDECAYLDIQDIRGLYSSADDVRGTLLGSIARGKEKYRSTKALSLPPVITGGGDVWMFEYPDTEPNFITMGSVAGEVALLDGDVGGGELRGKVVLVENADPGYDWVFSRGVGGLITMYGGANSHMAIRAGEMGVPAAIGVGEKRFREYRNAEAIELDARSKSIRVIF